KAMLAFADDSLGAAIGVARTLGGAEGARIAAAARAAFVDATHVALLVGACVAALGAYLIFRILPPDLGRLERTGPVEETREPVTASAS
ncbi:MAG TPA: hypothetical protein VKJ07_22660, partial [Mycobacteriales bacterium]|nr:hypothetical protein [Mycobacteriales bacterium]